MPSKKLSGNLSPVTSNCNFLSSCFYSLCPVHLQLIAIVLSRCQKASEAFRVYVSSFTCLFFYFWPMVFQIPLLGTFLCGQTQKIPLADQTFGAIENQVVRTPRALAGTVLTPTEPQGCSRQQKEIIKTRRKQLFWNVILQECCYLSSLRKLRPPFQQEGGLAENSSGVIFQLQEL